MDTSPKNQRALRHTAKPRPARQPNPGELVWSLRDAKPPQIDCELRDQGQWGVEVQIWIDRGFLHGRRRPSRALALEEAETVKAEWVKKSSTA